MPTEKGYKQTQNHIEKRKRFGEKHHAWKGCAVSIKGGRTRAYRLYENIGLCVLCGSARSERHHIDGDTSNNNPTNVIILCRKCHMKNDGRLEKFRKMAIANSENLVAISAERRRNKTTCHNGHFFTEENTYINPSNARVCKMCRRQYKREWRKNGSKKV